MIRTRFISVIGLAAMGATMAHATWFTNEAAFVSAIQANFYLEEFTGVVYGDPPSGDPFFTAPGANGYGWTGSAASGIWMNDSALSTNVANEPLLITFTGSPVSAFGGRLSSGDFDGNLIPGSVSMTIVGDGNPTNSVTITTTEMFLGWVGTGPLVSATLTASAPVTNVWPAIDNVYTGAAAVPEPASMAALGLGIAALIRRRRSKKA